MNWLKALGLVPTGDKVPPGWLTSRQIARKLGKDISTVREALKTANVETRKFRASTGSRIQLTPHYRIKPSAPRLNKP